MTNLIGIGASGISAYNTALATIGDNVSNAQTPGYARRSTVLQESPAASGTVGIYRDVAGANGVSVAGVSRAWNDFQAQESRVASSDASAADARMRWLTNAQSAVDSSDSGPGALVTAFFNAADSFAGNPGNDLSRSGMLSALSDAADSISGTAASLARVASGIATEAGTTVSGLNGNLTALANINQALSRTAPGTSAQAALFDQRDQLLDNISAQIGIGASFDANGAVTVTVAGSGTTLLSGGKISQLVLQQASDGRLALSISAPDGTVQPVGANGGSLAGLVDAAATVASRRQQLNGIATSFVAAINGWQANGVDANGNAGAPLLGISGGADTLQVLTTDPAAIAAASTDGTANGNLLALQPLRSNGAEQQIAAMISQQAQLVSSATAQATATATQRDNAFAARDTTSGVDLDQEAADLLRFQQAYQGSAKIIQAARDTFQSLLQSL